MSERPSSEPGIQEQLRALNGSVDRLLILAMDHGKAIDDVKADLGYVKADVRQIRREVTGIHEAFTEHLGWHLGRE